MEPLDICGDFDPVDPVFSPFIVVEVDAFVAEVPPCVLDQFDIEEGVDP